MCKGPVLFFKTTKYEDAQVFKAFLKPYPFLIKCEILYCGTCSIKGRIYNFSKEATSAVEDYGTHIFQAEKKIWFCISSHLS